jgi:hypothetical protein
MAGETADRDPREHARPDPPAGWYADPAEESSLRWWDGENWTGDVEPWPTPPGTGSTTGNTGHSTLDKDDVKAGFTATFLIGCLTLGTILGILALMMVVIMSLAVSQDPGFRNGGRDPSDRPTSETSP